MLWTSLPEVAAMLIILKPNKEQDTIAPWPPVLDVSVLKEFFQHNQKTLHNDPGLW